MDKEEMKDPIETAATVAEGSQAEVVPTKREELNAILAGEIEGYDPADDEGSAVMLMDYVNNNINQRQMLADALQEDPRLAQVLSDIVSKKRGAGAALARYYGKDFLTAEEGTPEYEEINAAEEERKKEMESMTARGREYEENVAKSMPVVEEWCKEKGYDTQEFLDKVWDMVVAPIFSGIYTRELCEFLDKGMNYDKDTEDALQAGVIKGHNDNINKMREERGDGMPKGMSSATPVSKKERKRSPLLEAALQA